MKKFVIGLMFLGLASQGFSQKEDKEASSKGVLLTGVTVSPVINSEYLAEVQEGVYSSLVLFLEEQVARFDMAKSPIYRIYKEPAKEYKISFRQANARIKAAFDNSGSLLWSFEKYKNIACPENVRNTLSTEYREWKMKSNTYFVHYSKEGELRRVYKIELENGNKKQAIKLNPEGKHFDKAETSIPFDLVIN